MTSVILWKNYWRLLCQLPIYWLLAPNPTFFALLCDNGVGFYKHFSFASWLTVSFVSIVLGEHCRKKKGGLFFPVLVCFCLLALMACSTQQYEGHSMVLTLQQCSAECLWVPSQKILLLPQLAPQLRSQQEAFQQVLLLPRRQFSMCHPRLWHQWTLSSTGPEPHLLQGELNHNPYGHGGASLKVIPSWGMLPQPYR